MGQDPEPTRVPFNQACLDAGVDENNLIRNGDFETGNRVPDFPPGGGWNDAGAGSVIRREVISDEQINHYLQLNPGSVISQVPSTESNYNFFDLKLCAIIPEGGQLQISFGGNTVAFFPLTPGNSISGQLEDQKIGLDLSTGESSSSNRMEILYINPSGEPALIDNLQLIVNTNPGGDGDETPTPEIPEETPTPVSGGPTITPTPTFFPGRATPRPTPGITDHSVQAIVNPPMLMVSPDDFAGREHSKIINLDLQIVGSDGEPIDITGIDPDATVRFDIETRGDAANIGTIRQLSGTSNWRTINRQSIKLSDLESFQFFPTKPYNGTVKIIADIEYKSFVRGKEEKRKIRGVIPIVLRVNSLSSLTNATGSFNPAQNFGLNRKPGDRGFRPDVRTNLFFRERFGQ